MLGLGADLFLQRRHLGEQRLLLLGHLFGFVALTQVGRAHERVGLHLGRRAVGDDLTEVEHVDVVTRAHHEAHVVLDEQDREPRLRELDEQLGEVGGLRLVETRRRLVEQHDARLGRQCARHLDETLRAGGQTVDALLGDGGETHALDELVGEHTGLELLARPALAHLRRDQDVVAHAERAERLEPLERAADAEPRALVRLDRGDVLAVEHDGAAGRWLQTRDDVEQGGLARPVGTDETGHLVLGNVDGDGSESLETAETHRDLVDVEKRHDARTYPKTSRRVIRWRPLVGSAAELHRDPDLAVAAVRDAHAGRRVRAVEDVLAVPG